MKKIILFLFLLTASLGYSQTVLEDFEGTEPVVRIENDSGGLVSIEVDPESGGTRGNTMKMITSAAAESWAQAELFMQADQIDLTAGNTDREVTVDIYSTTPRTFMAKVVAGTGPESAGNSTTSHNGEGWQTITFSFAAGGIDGTPAADGIYSKIFFFPFRNTATNGWNDSEVGEWYFDNIIAIGATAPETCSDGIQNNEETGVDCGGPNCDACPVLPATAAPTPPARNAGDVVSLYSDAYSDLASNFDAGWCGDGSVETIEIEGNNTAAYKGNNCQGIVLTNGVDITSYTNMHVDVYIEESADVAAKVFNLKFVQQPGGAALEVNFNAGSSPALVAGSWLSIDVPVDLAIFTGFKEFGITAGNLKNQVWYDNLYIYRAATASVSDNALLNISMYPNPTSSRLNISAASTIKNASIFNVLGKKVMRLEINKNSESIDVSSLASGIYLIKYQLNDATGTAKFIKE